VRTKLDIYVFLAYTFVQIILNDTYRYVKFGRLLKVLFCIIMSFFSNCLKIAKKYLSFLLN